MPSVSPALGLVLFSALGYAGATVLMVRLGGVITPALVALVGAAMLFAVTTEIWALRHLPVGVVYLAILGLETLMVLSAAFWLGQPLGRRELLAAGLVLSGTALLATSSG